MEEVKPDIKKSTVAKKGKGKNQGSTTAQRTEVQIKTCGMATKLLLSLNASYAWNLDFSLSAFYQTLLHSICSF